MAVFTISPLDWKHDDDGDALAQTPFGSYSVADGSSGWTWGYDFGYPDQDRFLCESINDGKVRARADWHERLSGALAEVQEDGK